jgi:hypothetical protein
MTEQQRLRELGDFAELFRSPWFRLGEWDKIGFRLSDETEGFVRHCYDEGWVTQLDWPEWAKTDEAQNLRDADVIRTQATAEQLAWLLTVAIRQSRFVEGGLVTWHENGWLLAICQRAKTLADLT